MNPLHIRIYQMIGGKFGSIWMVLLLQQPCVSSSEEFQVLGSPDPVVSEAGEDVVLPCYLKPPTSAVDLEVRWFRVDFTQIVHLYQDRETRNENQVQAYSGRTELFPEELAKGNTSLKLTAVRGSDGGKYTCLVQSLSQFHSTSINVMIKGSYPVVSIEGQKEGGVSVVCESKGWYPEPEIVWLDWEGNRLPNAGPTVIQKDSCELYSVRRYIISHIAEGLVCQVYLQQEPSVMKKIEVSIPGDMFHSALPWKVACGVLFFICLLIATSFLVRFCIKQKRKEGQLTNQNNMLLDEARRFGRRKEHIKIQMDKLCVENETLKARIDELEKQNQTK